MTNTNGSAPCYQANPQTLVGRQQTIDCLSRPCYGSRALAAHGEICRPILDRGSARINLVVGEAEAGGNHLLEFRGFESLPVKPSQQPEPSLACECGNALLEA
jgi:hypothetical protein